MAIPVAVGDILSARAWTSTAAQAAVNTYNFECIAQSGGVVTDQDFCNSIDAITALLYGPLCSSNVNYNGVQTYYIRRSPMVLPNPVKTTSSAGPCTGTGGTLPTEIAAILKYNSVNRGPHGRGRVFLPFVAGQFNSAFGKPTNALDVLVNSFCSTMLSPLVVSAGGGSATFAWCLVKRELLPSPPSAVQIVHAESAGNWGQQHKRGDYGRLNTSPI